MGHTITHVLEDSQGWHVTYFSDDTPEENGYTVLVPYEAVANRMGAYGIPDPGDALLAAIHDYHWVTTERDPRDDPALIQGYVTSTEPDAEMITLYGAASSVDAAGAYLARTGACREEADLKDPDGLLPVYEPHPDRVRHHREMTDTTRWVHRYGDLPEQPRSRLPRPPRIPIQED